MAPKTVSSGKTVLDIAAQLAVIFFNDGLQGIMEVMKKLNIIIGSNCYNFCREANAMRITLSERSFSEKAKEDRKGALASRKDEEQENIELEGQLYGSGIAD